MSAVARRERDLRIASLQKTNGRGDVRRGRKFLPARGPAGSLRRPRRCPRARRPSRRMASVPRGSASRRRRARRSSPSSRTGPRTSKKVTLAAGTRLGPYEILSPIGAGGMGEVYKAKDTRLERTVAVKVLPQHLSASPESPAALRARGEDDLAALAPAHLRALRRRQRGRDRVPRHGVPRGRDALGPPRAGARCRSSRRCGSASRSPTRSTRRTGRGSCTGT